MSYANSVFSKAYDAETTKPVEFQSEWNNGTGYFDALVHANLDLLPGELARAWTGDVNRRRVVIMATVFGNVVVFDRFTDNPAQPNPVFTFNAPSILSQLGFLESGALNGDALTKLLGDPKYPSLYPNLGQQLGAIKSALDHPEKHIRRLRAKHAV